MAGRIGHAHPRLDVLINNAGMLTSYYQETEEGFELQFGVNHLAPFLLTNLLLPNLEAAPAARVINVSSDGHYRAKSPYPTWTPDNKYEGFVAYCQSKLCNVLFTAELARRTEGTALTTNSLHPGVVSTGIGQKHTGSLGWFWRFMRPFFMNSEKGAATSLYLATSPEVAQVSGQYFDDRKEKKPSSVARDAQLAQELWTRSEEMVGMGREA
jgi:NAD(P)-dependent dehydrogenase (short-subunit alcohol dehydrogenase family)